MTDAIQIEFETTAKITFGHVVSSEYIRAFLSKIPKEAKIEIEGWEADGQERTKITMTATWTSEPKLEESK